MNATPFRTRCVPIHKHCAYTANSFCEHRTSFFCDLLNNVDFIRSLGLNRIARQFWRFIRIWWPRIRVYLLPIMDTTPGNFIFLTCRKMTPARICARSTPTQCGARWSIFIVLRITIRTVFRN